MNSVQAVDLEEISGGNCDLNIPQCLFYIPSISEYIELIFLYLSPAHMSHANGFVLVLTSNREQVFLQCANAEEDFAEPVPDFVHSRNAPLVCFVVNTNEIISHLCLGRRGMRAGTGIRRLNVKSITPLSNPINISNVIDEIPNRLKNTVRDRFTSGGLFTEKSFQAVVNVIRRLAPETQSVLDRFSHLRAERIRQISGRARESLAYQQQALVTALSIAGLDRDQLQDWSPPNQGTPSSFLDGLPSARLREDPMVINDLTKVPGFDLVKKFPYNAAVFESDSERLTVVLANRLPLEEQTGTDLVYFNETYQSFVMVQYKAMERDDEEGALFRLPSLQLNEEIQRMDRLLEILHSYSNNNHRDGFRLNENPFFLKLCPRIVFQPDDIGLIPGMYLPLDYWKVLSVHPSLRGPRGGLRVTYENVERYFDNTDFIKLVAKAWVGTNTNQSAVLKNVIREVIETGKAIVIAVKANTAVNRDAPHAARPLP